MSAAKQLSLFNLRFNFVKQKCATKQADPGPSANQQSEQHPIIVIDETEDPSNVVNQEPEQHQLINASEDPNKDEGEIYGSIVADEIDDEDIFAALVQTSKSPSPCCTPVMVYSSDDDNHETTRFSPHFSPEPDEVVNIPQSHNACSSNTAFNTIDTNCTPFRSTFELTSTANYASSQLSGRTSVNDALSYSIANTATRGSTAEVQVCTSSSSSTPILESSLTLLKDIAESLDSLPTQPVKSKYPFTMFSRVQRSFNAAWYKQYK